MNLLNTFDSLIVASFFIFLLKPFWNRIHIEITFTHSCFRKESQQRMFIFLDLKRIF